jgi:hypothetical protein
MFSKDWQGGNELCWKEIWKIKNHPKTIIFLWLTLANKVLTWEVLQRRAWQSPGICVLCISDGQTITHLLIHCPFTKELCADSLTLIEGKGEWNGNIVEECLKHWYEDKTRKDHRDFPVFWAL